MGCHGSVDPTRQGRTLVHRRQARGIGERRCVRPADACAPRRRRTAHLDRCYKADAAATTGAMPRGQADSRWRCRRRRWGDSTAWSTPCTGELGRCSSPGTTPHVGPRIPRPSLGMSEELYDKVPRGSSPWAVCPAAPSSSGLRMAEGDGGLDSSHLDGRPSARGRMPEPDLPTPWPRPLSTP